MNTFCSRLNTETQRKRDAEYVERDCIETKITGLIIDTAIEVHKTLGGPGLLESIYEDALFYELGFRNIPVKRQLLVPVYYKGVLVRESLRLDLLVDDKVIVEVKATEMNSKISLTQLLTYLRLTNRKLGLVLNFGQALLKDGISRVIND